MKGNKIVWIITPFKEENVKLQTAGIKCLALDIN